MTEQLACWHPRPVPQPSILPGRWVRLEPLTEAHVDDLFVASSAPGATDRFRFLPDTVPTDRADMASWIARSAGGTDPMFFAVVDNDTGRTLGRQALMRIDPANGVAEIGNILWGPGLTRTRGATEALFLFADHLFSLGYRRFEWKCDSLNEPSKRAAARFGFTAEGVFRQHLVVKGLNRDTAWFSIIDGEWPPLREEYLRWLSADNFDADGNQLTRLSVR